MIYAVQQIFRIAAASNHAGASVPAQFMSTRISFLDSFIDVSSLLHVPNFPCIRGCD